MLFGLAYLLDFIFKFHFLLPQSCLQVFYPLPHLTLVLLKPHILLVQVVQLSFELGDFRVLLVHDELDLVELAFILGEHFFPLLDKPLQGVVVPHVLLDVFFLLLNKRHLVLDDALEGLNAHVADISKLALFGGEVLDGGGGRVDEGGGGVRGDGVAVGRRVQGVGVRGQVERLVVKDQLVPV